MIGTSNDRKTRVSSTSESPTTTIPKGNRASDSRLATSTWAAVWPVTANSTPYRRSTSGPRARTAARASSVTWLSALPAGIATMTPVSAPRLGVATLVDTMPGVASTIFSMSATTPSGSVVATMSRVMTSGALAPGPKARATVSNASRWVDPGADVPLLGSARVRSRAGNAATPRPPMTRTAVSAGTFVTSRTHEADQLVCRRAWCASATRLGVSRVPAAPMSAGSRVRATTTAHPTPTAAAMPMTDRNGIWATPRASSAMATVAPAKTTADPAVPVAWAAASSTSTPSASRSRCRDRMNSA